MRPLSLHNREEIAAFLEGNVYRQLYSIGDLDDFFWPYTIWYGSRQHDRLAAVLLLYIGASPPVLLAHSDDIVPLKALLSATLPLLPGRVYAHLDPPLADVVAARYRLKSHGMHYRMGLAHPGKLKLVETSQVVSLTESQLPAIERLYAEAYAGNWFDPRMLQTGQYAGIWDGDRLVSIAGIHVYSPRYRVAALGNITTHPNYRQQGLARAVTAALCNNLLKTVDYIGLNVQTENKGAAALYAQLGFEVIAEFGEYMMEAEDL
jgi:ribosomal protein S18 acetylase RimI-like enzyme